MHLGLRLLFGFFVVTGIAAWFVLRVFVAEIRPSARDVTEDVLIDSANLLAEQAAPDLRAMPAGGTLEGTRFAQSVAAYAARPIDAQIWGLRKQTLDFRVYVTDAAGRVVFDSGPRPELGADYSRWRDVARTLRGEYGARATRVVPSDDSSSVMYVAAPVTDGDRVLGVLTIAKPQSTVHRFIERAERKVMAAGAWLLVLSLAVGVAVTLWTVHSVRRLRRYAQQASEGERLPVPALPGELGELAQAMGEMRDRLDGRHEVEQTMRALTHELKSPLTAIGAAAELLHDDLPRADRERFAGQIGEQVQRLRAMVERLLELSKLESLRAPEHPVELSLAALLRAQLQAQSASLAQRGLVVRWLADEPATVRGDAERLSLAISNLLANALAFAPEGSALEVAVRRQANDVHLELRDHGPGVPDYALPQLGRRFFSLPRPSDGGKGNGLGLAIAAQVAALHGGRLVFEPEQPGLRVRFVLPAA
ncbi:two-component system sensor histidine kinase CreC [Caldimonas sp. KR1-144]|uniref:two-component system sensor histidine kinase CreC n=1 Tax=Caldimonas sp. KR1-144 TaxID=3400911 RepID=UPI003C03CD77